MSRELMYCLISRMHTKLNNIIKDNNYDLLNSKVLFYSRRLDRVLMRYNKAMNKKSSP